MLTTSGELGENPIVQNHENPEAGQIRQLETPKDGGLIVIKLRDIDGLGNGKNPEFVLPVSTTLGQFMDQMTSCLSLGLGTFNVIYQTNKGDAFNLSHFPLDAEFSVLGILPSREKKYSLCLTKVRRPRPRAVDLDIGHEMVNNGMENGRVEREPQLKEMRGKNDADEDGDTECYEREFVGLKNQQQTCYLNSLIQTLFFCPEFRNFIYKQEVPWDPDKKSIILPLQKIFLQLQFSVRTSIGTDELTRTFGWKDDHNFIQHDIEELYRALLDHLGDELRRSGQPATGDALFGGIMNDYVECLQCHRRNSKLELSLGISVPVRSFGQRLSKPTLEEALLKFGEVEILKEPNQYRCESCTSLVDAEKGTSIHRLPYFLTLQLRRWEFDVDLMARRKINDRISFPFVLNMNPFKSGKPQESTDESKFLPPIDPDLIRTPEETEPRKTHSRPKAKIKNGGGEWKYSGEVVEYLETGPEVYQLLAVWVHEGGSSHRGHYYAHVYDLEKGNWYLCNDSFVRKSSEEEIQKTFGGGRGVDCNEDGKGEAYMLIYRRIQRDLNTLPMTWDQLPQHITDLWKSMETEDKRMAEAERYEKTIRRVNLSMRKKDGWEVDTMEAEFEKLESLRLATLKAYKLLHPEAQVDPTGDLVRLVLFNPSTLTSEQSWEGREEEPFGTLVRPHGGIQKETLLLQYRSDGIPFEPYAPTDGVLQVHCADWKEGRIVSTCELHLPHLGHDTTLVDLVGKIVTHFHLPPDTSVQIAYKNSEGGGVLLAGDPEAPLRDLLSNRTQTLELIVGTVGEGESQGFLDWASMYFGTYTFIVQSQMALEHEDAPSSDLGKAPIEYPSEMNLQSETEPQFEFDPLDNSINTPTKSNGFIEPLPSSQYFSVLSRDKSGSSSQTLSLRVSSSMTLSELSEHIGHELHQPISQFILYGVTGETEVEYTHVQGNITLRDLESFGSMRTRLGRRLGPTEIRVPLFLLDFSAFKEPPAYLTQVILHSGMTGLDIKETTREALEANTTLHQLIHSPCFRIRKKKGVFPGRILRDNTRFRDVFLTGSGELFVQPIPTEDTLGEKEFHVLIRQWKPSHLSLGQPFEVKVTHDYKEKVELNIRDQVSEVTGIDAERLEYLVPELDVDYPYELSPLLLQEKLTWRKFGTARILNVHTDQSALIVRDSMEIRSELSLDQREKYMKDFGEQRDQPLRKAEAGLTINLARTPPQ